MNATRINARPATPTAAQATAVNTTAAVPSRSPPRTKSRPWTVRVEVSAAPGRESAATPGPGPMDGAGPTRAAGRATTEAANPARTTAASSARRRDTVDSRPASSVYARRARSTCGSSSATSRLSRTTSAAIGSGARRQPEQPALRSAGAPQAGQG